VRSRSASKTYVVTEPDEAVAQQMNDVRDYLRSADLLMVDQLICAHADNRFRVRYYVTRPYARLAYMMRRNMFDPTESDPEPDIVVVQVPEWPETAIYVHPAPDEKKVYTYALGSDYYGEAKMGSLRAAMHLMREHRDGLGLHAASKLFHLRLGDEMVTRGAIVFGLSGTGKTTIALNEHGLEAPEGITVLQDDINMLVPSGYSYGTEKAFYVKTDSITGQPTLLVAAQKPEAIGENVWVTEDGLLDFDNWTLTTNGRAVVQRWAIPHTGGDIVDLPKVDVIFFVTRRYDLPPVGRLMSPAQAAAFLMLGESTFTSADDPTRVGQSQRVVAFDPFILGNHHKQGEFLYRFLQKHPEVRVYLLNTGMVGGMEGGVKIPPAVTLRAVEQIVRGEVEWQQDEALGYETPRSISGVDLDKYDPYRIYGGTDNYTQLLQALHTERLAHLEQFPELSQNIKSAVHGG
jgi:phosphoenolpyruvate carboxykinase (ATP)